MGFGDVLGRGIRWCDVRVVAGWGGVMLGGWRAVRWGGLEGRGVGGWGGGGLGE